MIIRNSHYMILSQSSNTHYWEQDRFPAWSRFVAIRHFPEQRIGLVYTPMGVVHHFQMHTNGENNAFVTRLERQKRPIHILVEQDGPPEKTVPGFVVAGAQNSGTILIPGPRCPFAELRMVTLAAGEAVAPGQLPTNEHLLVCDGVLHLALDNREIELYQGDLALLRAGVVRRLWTEGGCRVVLVREQP